MTALDRLLAVTRQRINSTDAVLAKLRQQLAVAEGQREELYGVLGSIEKEIAIEAREKKA